MICPPCSPLLGFEFSKAVATGPEDLLFLLTKLRPLVFIGSLARSVADCGQSPDVHVLPTPLETLAGMMDLARQGLLLKYAVASLFRVTWGFISAALLAIPIGLTIGWYRRAEMAINPLIQILRPISPLAWIPIAILWFGVGDIAAIFLIFVSCFFPLLLTAINAVQGIPAVYLNAGRNFGLSPPPLFTASSTQRLCPN